MFKYFSLNVIKYILSEFREEAGQTLDLQNKTKENEKHGNQQNVCVEPTVIFTTLF